MIGKRLVRLSTRGIAGLLLWAGAGCKSGTEPHIRPCTAADKSVILAPAQYVSIDPAVDSGCAVFPSTVLAAEYLVVPQITTGVPGAKSGFRLGGDTILPPPPPSAPAGQLSADIGAAERFHTFLRLGDERRWWGFDPVAGPAAAPLPQLSSALGPPAMNNRRVFQVCATVDCSRFNRVVARARAVKPQVAIDIDSNAVVMVLMTNTVNKLVSKTTCQNSGFVAGFFYGLDLDPHYRTDSRSNKGEVFYSIVPDPAGVLSCSHTTADVESFVPVTFIHEFQHMISFNQHVLVGNSVNGEVLWLNEGFSHYAEELGGRTYEASFTARLSDCVIGTVPCRFYGGDLLNAYTYLDSTSRHSLEPTSGLGTLAERGAAWLFVRYVVDRYAAGNTQADWNAVTRALLATTNTGAANIAAVTGDPFTTVASRWALANWVSDLPAFTPPTALTYDSWSFRSTYASLHAQRSDVFQNAYPLVPAVSAGRDVSRSGTLLAGSGIYQRATQSPGDPGFTLSFTAPSGAVIGAGMVPRLNVIRIQ